MQTGHLRYASLYETIDQLKANYHSNTNLLFLDFDGVWIIPEGDYKTIVSRINQLCKSYDLEVVITSSHRKNIEMCEEILRIGGFTGTIQGRTELSDEKRYVQILNYLHEHPFQYFVILDDMFMEALQDYAVLCHFFTGFDEIAYQSAVAILEQQIHKD